MVEAEMGRSEQMRVILFSFGFKYGTPVDVNLVWDVRFLPNPYWVDELRPKTGREEAVATHVLDSPEGKMFFNHLEPLLHFLVQQNIDTGKQSLRIGIGCTGGRHRSVAVTEKIAAILSDLDVDLTTFHRDIERDVEISG
jgi:UPF0042 nucleotide-binding protein